MILLSRIRIRRPRIIFDRPKIPDPSRWIGGISGSSFSAIRDSVSNSLKALENEISDLPNDVKREVSNVTDIVQHWNEQQLNVYKNTYNKLVEVAVELSANLGADEAAKKIITRTATLYQESGGTNAEDCSLIVRAAIFLYAYSIKETKPDLSFALLATVVTDAIPAACRIALS